MVTTKPVLFPNRASVPPPLMNARVFGTSGWSPTSDTRCGPWYDPWLGHGGWGSFSRRSRVRGGFFPHGPFTAVLFNVGSATGQAPDPTGATRGTRTLSTATGYAYGALPCNGCAAGLPRLGHAGRRWIACPSSTSGRRP